MTGSPRRFARRMMSFWIAGTSSGGSSVPAGDHHPVGLLEDRIQPGDGLGLLELGDDRHLAPGLGHRRPRLVQVAGLPHEGHRDVVHAGLDREDQVLAVLRGEGLGAQRDTGKVDALVVLEEPAVDHLGAHQLLLVRLQDPELEEPVVEEDPVAGVHVRGEEGIGGGDDLLCPRHRLVGGDGERGPGDQLHLPLHQLAGADLGTLEVAQDAHRLAHLQGGGPEHGERLRVLRLGPVAEVHPGDVHAGVQQVLEDPGLQRSGPEGTDDLGASHGL